MQDTIPKQVSSATSILCPGHTRTVVGLNRSETTPDGVFFVSACLDKTPMLRDMKTGNWVGSFVGHEGAVWSAQVNKNATRVVTGSADFSGRLWNAVTGELLHVFPEKHIVKAACINLDSSLVAFGGKSKEVNIYSTSTFDRVHTFDFQEEVGFLQFCPLPESPSLLLCVGISGKLSLLDASHEIRSLQLTDIILDVSLSGDVIVVATCNGVRFFSWDLTLLKKKDYPFHVNSCSLNSEHTYYLISDVNTIYEVDYQTDVIHRSYNGHHGVVLCLRYSPDGTSFISGSDDSSIRLWTVD
ncbi:hypothetical protein WA577_002197, partial [Blastocystis sp. JDR]